MEETKTLLLKVDMQRVTVQRDSLKEIPTRETQRLVRVNQQLYPLNRVYTRIPLRKSFGTYDDLGPCRTRSDVLGCYSAEARESRRLEPERQIRV